MDERVAQSECRRIARAYVTHECTVTKVTEWTVYRVLIGPELYLI